MTGWGSLIRAEEQEALARLHSVGTAANKGCTSKGSRDPESTHCGSQVCLQTGEFNRIQTLCIYSSVT